MPLLRGETLPAERELYFTRREGGRGHDGKSYECLIRGRWKLMQNDPYRPLELYDLEADPQEMADLFAYLTLDKPPEDPTARRLPGVYDEPAGDAKKPLTPQ